MSETKEVFEIPEKPKRKRKPMSASKKKALTERLALGRAKKKALKENEKKDEKPNITMEVESVKETPKEPMPEPEPAPKPDNSLEMKALQDQINSMKLEKLEALEKKNEKKRIAIEKRRATMNRKAIEKANKNDTTKPANIRKPVEKMEVIKEVREHKEDKMDLDSDLFITKKPRYSTFKRSVWSTL